MNSWLRRHSGDRVVALAIWVNGKCDASVYDGTPSKVGVRVPCDTEEQAKTRAEQLLLEAYPHDCVVEKCPDWDRFAHP